MKLKVKARVIYWEDAIVNGIHDENGDLIPCRIGDMWCPEIDFDTGRIVNWEEGKYADIHFKVCDGCSWIILDNEGKELVSADDEYVPASLSPEAKGYGDYIIMKVDKSGQIKNWKAKLSDFETGN